MPSSRWIPCTGALRLLSSVSLIAHAGTAAEPYRIPATEQPPILDGRLDESVWDDAVEISGFLQRSPVEGAPATERSVVRLCYSPTHLFVGVRCHDRDPDQISASVMRRDDFAIVENDQFVVAIDSFSDNRNGYFFSTNPLGVKVDAQFFDEGARFVDAWDGVWEVAARIDSLGWAAEFRIPFATLPFRAADRNEMGINLFRRHVRTNEELYSPLVPRRFPSGTPTVSQARKIVFHQIDGGGRLRVEPYWVGRHQTGTASAGDFGGDLRWAATHSMTASVSVNTDFAQVESDARRINLTQYDLFFPEKRDFFLENAGLFEFGVPSELELFFSRRIGLVSSELGTRSVPIQVGGKLSGRTTGTEAGLLYVRTGDTAGVPDENFLVGRFKREIRQRSYLGGIVTRRSATDAAGNATAGLDALLRLPHDLAFSGLVAGTTDDQGRAHGSGATHWRLERTGEQAGFHAEYLSLGANFSPAIGFLQRARTRSFRGGLHLPWHPRQGAARQWAPSYDYIRFEDREGRLRDELHRVEFRLELRSAESIALHLDRSSERVDEGFELLDGVPVSPGLHRAVRGGVSAATKPGRPVSGRLGLEVGDAFGGSRRTISGALGWKVNRHWTVAQSFERSRIELPGGASTALALQTRGDFSLDVASSLSLLLQHDNVSDELGIRAQARHIFREGTELLLVYTGAFTDTPAGQVTDARHVQTVILKATYGFHL